MPANERTYEYYCDECSDITTLITIEHTQPKYTECEGCNEEIKIIKD